MTTTICMYCRKQINPNNDEFIEVEKGKVHKVCYEQRQQAMAIVLEKENTFSSASAAAISKKTVEKKSRKADLKKCFYCNKTFDISKEEYNMVNQRRYAHKNCYDTYHTADDEKINDIYTFLREEALITYDFVQCEKQREQFIKKFGYTNEGILNALKYWYKVKRQSPEKAGNRIGIVPYIYSEANEYYANIEKKQKQITKVVQTQMKKKAKKITIGIPEKPVNKGFIDLDAIERGNA